MQRTGDSLREAVHAARGAADLGAAGVGLAVRGRHAVAAGAAVAVHGSVLGGAGAVGGVQRLVCRRARTGCTRQGGRAGQVADARDPDAYVTVTQRPCGIPRPIGPLWFSHTAGDSPTSLVVAWGALRAHTRIQGLITSRIYQATTSEPIATPKSPTFPGPLRTSEPP